jgi:hypothetical protein
MSRIIHAAPAGFIPLLAISAFAGIRSAEIAGLDWSAVDSGNQLKNRTRQRILVFEWLEEGLRRGGLQRPLRAVGLLPEGFVATQSKVPIFSFAAPRLVEASLVALPGPVLQQAPRRPSSSPAGSHSRHSWIGGSPCPVPAGPKSPTKNRPDHC